MPASADDVLAKVTGDATKRDRAKLALSLARAGMDAAEVAEGVFNGGASLSEARSLARWAVAKADTPDASDLTDTASIVAALNLGEPRFNLVTGDIVLGNQPIPPGFWPAVRVAGRRLKLDPAFAEDAVRAYAGEHAFHPIAAYLSAAQQTWRTAGRPDAIATLAAHITPDPMAQSWVRKWIIAAARRVDRVPGRQFPMLVLAGPQGCGKSHLARWLGTPSAPAAWSPALGSAYYAEAPLDPDSHGFDRWVAETWVWEVGELGATVRRRDVEALKLALTKETCSYRRPYDRERTVRPALASYIGTVNDAGGGFLSDPTGHRRFLVVDASAIDWAYSRLSVHHIWGQARELNWEADVGAGADLTAEEAAAWRARSEEYEMLDPTEELVRSMIRPQDGGVIPAAEVLARLAETDPFARSKAGAMVVGATLRDMGGIRRVRRYEGRNRREWAGVAWVDPAIPQGPYAGQGHWTPPVRNHL